MIAGTVLQLQKAVGEDVEADEPVMMLECMKMEIPIVAPSAGLLARIDVKEGDTVTKDQLVFVLET
jgi:acetyl-CoA carboxylase biotin carboxyl carrier protein